MKRTIDSSEADNIEFIQQSWGHEKRPRTETGHMTMSEIESYEKFKEFYDLGAQEEQKSSYSSQFIPSSKFVEEEEREFSLDDQYYQGNEFGVTKRDVRRENRMEKLSNNSSCIDYTEPLLDENGFPIQSFIPFTSTTTTTTTTTTPKQHTKPILKKIGPILRYTMNEEEKTNESIHSAKYDRDQHYIIQSRVSAAKKELTLDKLPDLLDSIYTFETKIKSNDARLTMQAKISMYHQWKLCIEQVDDIMEMNASKRAKYLRELKSYRLATYIHDEKNEFPKSIIDIIDRAEINIAYLRNELSNIN